MDNKNNTPTMKPTPTMLIHDCDKLFGSEMRRLSDKAGVPSGYRLLLMHLGHDRQNGNRGVPQHELAKCTHLSPPTISVTLKNMESDGLIVRRNDEKDERLTRVFLTDAGVAMDDRIRDSAGQTEKKALTGLSECEIETLETLLTKIKTNLADGNECCSQSK